jgi:hypothetical protein
MNRVIAVVFLMSLLTVSLWAQQATTGVDGFKFVAPMEIAIGTDNNFLVDRTNPNERLLVLSLPGSIQPGAPDIRPKMLDDKVMLMRLPKVAYQNNGKRHEFVTTWVPEFEIFKQNGDQNAMNQQAMASFNYYITKNLQVFIGDFFQTTKDPARSLNNVFLLLPRSSYRSNDVHGTLEFQPTPVTNIALSYDTAWTKFGQTDPFQTQILDSRSAGYGLTVTRLLGQRQRLSFRYSVFKVTPINQQKEFDAGVDVTRSFTYPIHAFSGQYRIQVNPNLLTSVSGGIVRLDNGLNYTLGGTVFKRFGYFWVGGGYTRSLAFQNSTLTRFASGLNGNGFYDVVTFRVSGQPTRKTAVLLDTTMSRGATSRLIDNNEALLGRVRLDYRLSDRNVLFTTWESFQQTRNTYVNAPLSRNRFMMGIEISFATDTQRRVDPLNEDTQYVSLTDHGRRRKSPEDNN